MAEHEVKCGDIVYSKAGRDKGNYFVVMSVEDIYVFICDGDGRKVDKPKKKKQKHIRNTGVHAEYIGNKINNGEKVTNAELRRTIQEFDDLRLSFTEETDT